MQEFRCTRIAQYQHNCDGHHDLSCRSGYYIKAKIAMEAIQIMRERFPDEKDIGFTVQSWSGPWTRVYSRSHTTASIMNNPVDIQLVHPKLIKAYSIPGDGAQAPGAITLREWRPGKEWVTHFRNLQSGGYYYGKYFTSLADAEANFRQRVLEFGGRP